MTTRDQATPRPWKVDDSKPKQLAVIMDDSDGEGICEMEYRQGEGKANAALIVEAVNAYDGLRAENDRLREALEAAQIEVEYHHSQRPVRSTMLALDKIRAALSGGKGE